MATRKKITKRSGSSGRGNPRNTGPSVEQQHEDAMRVLRAEYYGAVRDIAKDLIDRAKSGDISNEDEFYDAIHQDVDGSAWVIYTHSNFQVLMCSDHHDAYSEEHGEAPVSGADINWQALAFAALQRDVTEQINAEGWPTFGGGDLDETPRRVRARSTEDIKRAEELGAADARQGREPLWYRVDDSYVNAETGRIGNSELGAAYLRGYNRIDAPRARETRGPRGPALGERRRRAR